jgi:ArsR family transcriptional regulator
MTNQKFKLSPEQCRQLSDYLTHLSHPLRLRLICQLHRGEKNVSQLIEAVKRQQSTVSTQLKYLLMAGIVAYERRGQFVYYRIADRRASGLLRYLVGAFGMLAKQR